jgi:hypothetical protein
MIQQIEKLPPCLNLCPLGQREILERVEIDIFVRGALQIISALGSEGVGNRC